MHTARTDHRLKTVGTVVPGNVGTSFRSSQPDGLADARIDRTERGGNEHSTNRRLSRGDSLLLGNCPLGPLPPGSG